MCRRPRVLVVDAAPGTISQHSRETRLGVHRVQRLSSYPPYSLSRPGLRLHVWRVPSHRRSTCTRGNTRSWRKRRRESHSSARGVECLTTRGHTTQQQCKRLVQRQHLLLLQPPVDARASHFADEQTRGRLVFISFSPCKPRSLRFLLPRRAARLCGRVPLLLGARTSYMCLLRRALPLSFLLILSHSPRSSIASWVKLFLNTARPSKTRSTSRLPRPPRPQSGW